MTPPRTPPEPAPSDYDENPGRVRLARSVLRCHAVAGDVHEPVARRFVAEGLARVLDVGCGEGELARYLPDGAWVGLDNSQTMLDRGPAGGVRGEATALPFPDESFDGVAILYVLYHLSDPRRALAEARRVMRPGGLIAVAAPSRHDSPELAHALPKTPLTFDAELAPGLLRGLFEEPEVKHWDAPLVELPTARDVRDYLIGKQVAPDRAQAVAEAVELPLSVTKRGPCCSPARAVDCLHSRRTSYGPKVPLLPGSRLELEVVVQNTDARARESLPP
jgi:SAM-dependent methyltransferase